MSSNKNNNNNDNQQGNNNNDDNSMPKRYIFSDVDMEYFKESSSRKDLVNFVEAMGKACASGDTAAFDPTNPLVGLTNGMASLHGSLCVMVDWVDDFPPSSSAQAMARFGNPAFRSWHKRLVERSAAIVTAILKCRDDSNISVVDASLIGRQAASEPPSSADVESYDAAIKHVTCFLHDAFGHATRLDYGTGHESSFVIFLLALSKVGCFGLSPSLETTRAVTLSIFMQYLQVTRRLQTDYRLEPAGSHGVWGLDDYHCLPFYFGSCQLQAAGVSPNELEHPNCINDPMLLSHYGKNYMYLSCITYIRELKKGVPFFESSPMLHDISQLPTWAQVTRGLLRLYQGEVLDKRQVVQHFLFSKFFPATWTPSQSERKPPTTTFRTLPPQPPAGGAGGPGAMPPTRAPWAK